MEKTGVIILEYNNSEDTLNCIKSVLKFNTAPIKFIVVDNASPKKDIIRNLKSGLLNLFPKLKGSDLIYNSDKNSIEDVTLVLANENKGYACGNNIGLEVAYKDPDISHVMILNSDILFVEDIIPTLLKDLKDDTAIVSPILFKKGLKGIDKNCARRELTANEIIKLHIPFPADPFKISEKKKIPIKLNSGLMQIDLPSGSCMLTKKSLFQQIEGFDPNTFLYYEEDILSKKIKKLGLKNYLNTNLKCIHLGATTTKKSASKFIVNKSSQSARYVLKQYYESNLLQNCIMSLFIKLIDFRMSLVEIYHKYF